MPVPSPSPPTWSTSRSWSRPTTPSIRTRPWSSNAWPSARPGTAVPRCRPPSTTTTSPRPRRRSASTARPRHRRAAVHRPRHPRPVRTGYATALEVLAANDVTRARRRARRLDARPRRSRTRSSPTTAAGRPALADGIVVTPSHNPPRDGGFKYNPPHGGPADTDATSWIAGPRQPAARGEPRRRRAHHPRQREGARHDRHLSTSSTTTSTTFRPSWTSTPSGPPGCTSAPTRWAALRSSTGARSANASVSISPS